MIEAASYSETLLSIDKYYDVISLKTEIIIYLIMGTLKISYFSANMIRVL
jgi:hypothetical protein